MSEGRQRGGENLVMRFQYADARMPYAMSRNGTTYYLTYDPVGTLRVVADQSGNVVKRIEYDSFGNVIADTDPAFEVPFGFAGGLHDRDTGLVRFGYRDYDPDIGRWTAKDPILFAGGDTDLYGYCLNDPVNWVDPDGLFSLPIPWWVPEVVQAVERLIQHHLNQKALGEGRELQKTVENNRTAYTKKLLQCIHKCNFNETPCNENSKCRQDCYDDYYDRMSIDVWPIEDHLRHKPLPTKYQ